MILSQLFILFMLSAFLGWVYECTYCTIKEKRWENRGFLIGPVCPIYGTGVVVSMLIFYFLPFFSGPSTPMWVVFLVCALGSAVLEYLTSWALEKKFHAKWWDYSDMPMNLNGRICLPATLAFGIAGVVFVNYIDPYLMILLGIMNHFAVITELVALLLALILGMDMAWTTASLNQMLEKLDAAQRRFNEFMESNYVRTGNLAGRISGQLAEYKPPFSLPAPKALLSNAELPKFRLPEQASEFLSWRHKYHFSSIRSFTKGRYNSAVLREFKKILPRFRKDKKNKAEEDTDQT